MDMEKMFRQVDFSADTDLKDRLRKRLFAGQGTGSKVVAFRRVDESDLEFVAAAKGLAGYDPTGRMSAEDKKDL